jgi:hypothetical protein
LWHHGFVKTKPKRAPASPPSKRPTRTLGKKPASPGAPGKAPKPAKGIKGAVVMKAALSQAPPRRADYGAPIDGFFTKHPPHLRIILEALREIVEGALPDATASIKWGMAHFAIGREMLCALAGFKAHVNLIVFGPPGTFVDPDGLLQGEGKGGRHIKLRALEELPREAARRWLLAAGKAARTKAGAAGD